MHMQIASREHATHGLVTNCLVRGMRKAHSTYARKYSVLYCAEGAEEPKGRTNALPPTED